MQRSQSLSYEKVINRSDPWECVVSTADRALIKDAWTLLTVEEEHGVA